MSIGGRLRLSSDRLTFTPGFGSRWMPLGRGDWECALTDAMRVGVGPRPRFLPGLNWTRRFGIVNDDVLDLFEVTHVDTVVAAIQAAFSEAIGRARSGASGG